MNNNSSTSTTKGGGEDAPFENRAKKRCVGTINVNIYTPCCTDVTSLGVPLAIEGHADGDGETKPAPVVVKIEGAERGKEGGTAPAVTTTAPEQPAGLSGDACCKCRAPVVVQDHAVWLPSGGPQLCVL